MSTMNFTTLKQRIVKAVEVTECPTTVDQELGIRTGLDHTISDKLILMVLSARCLTVTKCVINSLLNDSIYSFHMSLQVMDQELSHFMRIKTQVDGQARVSLPGATSHQH